MKISGDNESTGGPWLVARLEFPMIKCFIVNGMQLEIYPSHGYSTMKLCTKLLNFPGSKF